MALDVTPARSADLYHSLFQAHPVPMWVVDAHTLHFLTVNDAAVQQYGYNHAEFLAMTVLTVETEHDAPGRPATSVLTRHRRKDGTLIEVEVSRRDVTVDGRRAALTVALDVSARVAAERALAESERHFRALIEQSSDVVTLIDAETRILYASPSIEPVLGYAPEELLGRRAFELLHPDDLEPVMATLMEGVAIPGLTRRLEYRFRHRNGSWRFIEGVGRNLLDDPAVRAIVVNARDVTDRKAVEEALRDRERQLLEAQAIAHVGSWELDIASNTVTWSDELYRICGLPSGAPAGYAEFLALVHPEDRPDAERLTGGVFVHKQAVEFEWRLVRPNGEVRHIFSRTVPVMDATGQMVRVAGTCLDITERKRVEQNLLAALAEVKVLKGILPTCANCRRIKNEAGEWEQMEAYVRAHTNAEFSHGLCPDCAAKTWGAGS